MAGHSVPARVVNNDQISPTFFNKFRADASSGTGRDNRLSPRERISQAIEYLDASVRITFTSPGVGHWVHVNRRWIATTQRTQKVLSERGVTQESSMVQATRMHRESQTFPRLNVLATSRA